jgi:hypothetical protein
MTAYNLYFIYMYFVDFFNYWIDCLPLFATNFVGRIFQDRIISYLCIFVAYEHKIFGSLQGRQKLLFWRYPPNDKNSLPWEAKFLVE